MRLLLALLLAGALMLPALAQTSPRLVADRLQEALVAVREADRALGVPRGGEDAPRLAPASIQSLLARAAAQLQRAREAMVDPSEQAALDAAADQLALIRDRLLTRQSDTRPLLDELELTLLRLRRRVRTHTYYLDQVQATPSAR